MTYSSAILSINSYLDTCNQTSETAPWLESDFSSPIWVCSFEHVKKTQINWEVKLYNGTFLTSNKNKVLLNTLKYWLIEATKTSTLINSTSCNVYEIYLNTIHLFNYFILNDKEFEIHKEGLKYISESEIRTLIERTTSLTLSEAIYDIANNIKSFLCKLHKLTNSSLIKSTIAKTKYINNFDKKQTEIFNDNDDLTNINTLIEYRAVLSIHGYYNLKLKNDQSYRRTINTKKLLNSIFVNCIKTPGIKDVKIVKLLNFIKGDDCRTEYPVIPVTTNSKSPFLDQDSYYTFKHSFLCINELRLIHKKLHIPSENSLLVFDKFTPTFTQKGRYRTLPSPVYFHIVKSSIEFILEHGNNIIKNFILLDKHGLNQINNLKDEEFCKLINNDLLKLGVKYWSLHRFKAPQRGQLETTADHKKTIFQKT